jgi:hypothetical protein
MMIGAFAGISALVAAVATVVGAITLGLFFSRGQPWGTRNDVSSIVLMLATIPVAIAVAIIELSFFPWTWVAAAIGIAGMLGAAVAQWLLVAKRGTYEGLLPWTLGAGVVVGAWYLLIGLMGRETTLRGGLDALAIASGLGFIAVGVGFWRGGQQSRVAIGGGIMLLIASTWFLGWLGLRLVSGDIGIATTAVAR